MSAWLDFILTRTAMLAAVIGSPWLLARLLLNARPVPLHGFAAPLGVVLINTLLPITPQIFAIDLTPATLSALHLALFAGLLAGLRFRRIPLLPPGFHPDPRALALATGMALLLLPLTPLAGIDTYKWQDLASAVALEKSIPWLSHPLALFGYAPRSYPSAQPLLLATVQILGQTGVDWGFYVVSVLIAWMALATAWNLGRILWNDSRSVFLFTLFYLSAPVFMRYTHWATGRGLLMALFPGFLWFGLAALRPGLRALGLVGFGLALLLSHKVSLGAIPMALILIIVWKRLPVPRSPVVLGLLGVALWALAILFSDPTALSPALPFAPFRQLAARFGLLVPLLIAGLAAGRHTPPTGATPFLFWGLILTLPLAAAREMYGALPALPFVAALAVPGFLIADRVTGRSGQLLRTGLWLGIILGAVTLVAWRSAHAMPRKVYRAARYLDQYDPRGPLRIEAPGMARRQIQAYVAACPRIEKPEPGQTRFDPPPPPRWSGDARRLYSEAIAYFRRWLALDVEEFTWYGRQPRIYYVRIDGQGEFPPHPEVIYDREGVVIAVTANPHREAQRPDGKDSAFPPEGLSGTPPPATTDPRIRNDRADP